ncbi:MAG: ABC transporter permease subunit [Bacillota bacterium]
MLAKLVVRKAIYSVFVMILFCCVVLLVCSIPKDFSLTVSNGEVIASHSVADIYGKAVENVQGILSGSLSKKFEGKNQIAIMFSKLFRTAGLLISGIILGVILGVAKGIFDSGRGKESRVNLKSLSTIIPISMPDLFNIAVLQFLAVWLAQEGLKVFRVAGQGSINHTFLPIIALSILPSSYIARVTAVSIDSCYRMNYVIAARGKGCRSSRILFNHVMRNAVGIVYDGLSNITGLIICNLLIIEYMFSYMGLAVSLVQFYASRDTKGVIVVILMLGTIYLILDNIFELLKKLFYTPVKEGSI